MKHLLTGVAMAAALAIAAPVWAQNAPSPAPATPPAAAPSTAAPSTAMPSTAAPSAAMPSTAAPSAAMPSSAAPAHASARPMMHRTAGKPMHHMMHHNPSMHHAAMHHRGMVSSGDQMTEQLNQQELQRLQSGNTSAPPAAGAGMAPAPGMSAPPQR